MKVNYFYINNFLFVHIIKADDRCIAHHGGHLVSIHSEATNAQVLSVAGNALGSANWFWIGLQRNTAGGYRWFDGSAANYLKWGPTWGPNEEMEEDATCTDMGYQGLWGAEKCTVKNYYICEKSVEFENCVAVPKAEREPCG